MFRDISGGYLPADQPDQEESDLPGYAAAGEEDELATYGTAESGSGTAEEGGEEE